MNNKELKKQVNNILSNFSKECKSVKKDYNNKELTNIDYLNLLLDFTNNVNKQLDFELRQITKNIC